MGASGTRIEEFEEELRTTKYNKATQHHIGIVKAKIARLKEDVQRKAAAKKKGEGYAVRKTGDGTVCMLGFPSVGKSTLLNALTKAESKVAAYDFTTLDVIPGLLEYNSAKIQVLDVPGILHGAASGRGRGREVLAVLRSSDLILMVLDVFHPGHAKILKSELYEANIRINTRKPEVKIMRKPRGGVSIASTVKQPHVEEKTLTAILQEYRIVNADVVLRSVITVDEFIDVIEGNRIYLPAITVVNKIDTVPPEKAEQVLRASEADLGISAQEGTNLPVLRELIFTRLDLIRVYLKQLGKKPDMDVPLIMRRGSTVEDVCKKLHRDFVTKFRFCRVWGTSARFPGQQWLLDHEFHDRDVVEMHLR